MSKLQKTKSDPLNDNPFLLSGDIVAHLRNHNGMTLKEIGQLIGVGESYISRVANRQRNFTTEHLVKLEKALGKPLAMLILEITPLETIPSKLRPTFKKIFKVLEESGPH